MLGPRVGVVRLVRAYRRLDGRAINPRRPKESTADVLARARLWLDGCQSFRPGKVAVSGCSGPRSGAFSERRAFAVALWPACARRRRHDRAGGGTLQALCRTGQRVGVASPAAPDPARLTGATGMPSFYGAIGLNEQARHTTIALSNKTIGIERHGSEIRRPRAGDNKLCERLLRRRKRAGGFNTANSAHVVAGALQFLSRRRSGAFRRRAPASLAGLPVAA